MPYVPAYPLFGSSVPYALAYVCALLTGARLYASRDLIREQTHLFVDFVVSIIVTSEGIERTDRT